MLKKYQNIYNEEKDIYGFDFLNVYKCSDVQHFENLKYLSLDKFELCFCQERKERKLKKIPIENSKEASDRVVDL